MFSAYVRVWDPTQTRLGDPVCFFSNVAVSPDVTIGQATLTISENAAGSFDFTISRGNVANDLIHTMTSIIYVIKDGDWNHPFWIGRVITEETVFHGISHSTRRIVHGTSKHAQIRRCDVVAGLIVQWSVTSARFPLGILQTFHAFEVKDVRIGP